MNNHNKYLIYKKKYLKLKMMVGGGNDVNDDDIVTLQSNDNHEFKIPYKIIKQSETLRNLIKDSGIKSPLPLPNVTGKIFGHIIELLKKIHGSETYKGQKERDVNK